uniref:Retrotransposon gag domain-containing protein n=1 Tax=Meloidogyne incognita TaxID=6306 RepID=A0A914MMT7_MELIC
MSNNTPEDEIKVNAIDKRFWEGKQSIKIQDLERAHADVIKLEEGVNRALRSINRKTNTNSERINSIARDVNLNIKTLNTQIVTLAEQIERLGPDNCLQNETVKTDDISVVDQNLEESAQQEFINMISSNTGHLETFSDESIIAYDKWSEKFCDYVGAAGRAWTEPEKVARLKLALADTPRQLFKQLSQQETSTLDLALKSLRAKLDSPQRREITKRTLACCKQRDTETVSEFLKRLIPLVEVVNSSLDENQRKEKICEEFLDRVKPNIGFLIRLVGLSKEKDLDLVRSQAEELETMLASDRGQIHLQNVFPHSVQALTANPGNQSTSYSMPSRPFFNQNTLRTRYPNANFTPLNSQNSRYTPRSQSLNNRNDRWGGNQQQRSERKWNNRPFCNFCKRLGHTSYTCRERLSQFRSNQPSSSRNYREIPKGPLQSQNPGQIRAIQPSNRIVIDAEDLIHALAKLGTGNNQNPQTSGLSVNSLLTVDNIPKTPSNNQIKVHQTEPTLNNNLSRPKSSNWEGIGPKISRSLFMFAMLLIFATPIHCAHKIIPTPRQPIICQTQLEGVLWSLPTPIGCPELKIDYLATPEPETLNVYKPNAYEHEITSWACRKSNFIGLRKAMADGTSRNVRNNIRTKRI